MTLASYFRLALVVPRALACEVTWPERAWAGRRGLDDTVDFDDCGVISRERGRIGREGAANEVFSLAQGASVSISAMNGDARPLQPEVAGELVRIGAEAYEWRRRAGLTQREMEALTGLDQTTICKLERGKLPGLRLHHLARIRLACRTHKRVESTYGRRPPTRPARPAPTDSPG